MCAYEDGSPTKWMPHWIQRISAAIITGDARRCFEYLNSLKVGGHPRHRAPPTRARACAAAAAAAAAGE